MSNTAVMKTKTAEDLRDILFEEIDLLRSGKISAQRSRATANLARQVIESIRVQVQFGKLLTEMKGRGLGNEVPNLPGRGDGLCTDGVMDV